MTVQDSSSSMSALLPVPVCLNGNLLVSSGDETNEATRIGPLLTTTVPLSFWGGIDPLTGMIVDTTHPLHGESVQDTIFCLPSGRGSCTASQVLLELILNRKAPRAIVLRDLDGLVCVGALVAQEIFQQQDDDDNDELTTASSFRVPDIIHLGTEQYNQLLALQQQQQQDGGATTQTHGMTTPLGNLIVGPSAEQVMDASKNQQRGVTTVISSLRNLLTDTEQAMLDGATSEAQRMALWVLIRYGHIVCSSFTDDDNAATQTQQPTYVDIESAHIDGCTYIGPGGLELAQRLVQAGGRVQVSTTLNSVSCDRNRWQQLGVPTEYAHASLALGDAYLALGCQPSFTCAPYLLLEQQPADRVDDDTSGTSSLMGKDICWGESNAVVYANSVLGARTEKYADYLDICSALVGKTVRTGVHVPENRRPQIIIDATSVLDEIASSHQQWQSDDGGTASSAPEIDSLYPVLGHLCGTFSDGAVPLLLGLESWSVTKDNLKAFCAAFGTTGTSPLIHIAGITPEAQDAAMIQQYIMELQPSTSHVSIHMHDLLETYTTLDSSSSDSGKVDLVALGNPHLSIDECRTLSELVETVCSETSTKTKNESVRIMACMSRALYAKADVQRLQDFGVEFINDTCWCMLLDPPVIPTNPNSTILTNSGKYAHYGPGLTQRKFRFGSLHDCVTAAVTGTYRSQAQPAWLPSSRRGMATASMAFLKRVVR